MMFSEFQQGTGCRDNEHNHKVFRNLEAMYMNTDMTKQEIYEYGKKLVDNSKTEQEIALEEEIKREITEQKDLIAVAKRDIEWYSDSDIFCAKDYVKQRKEDIKGYRRRIAELKWVLGN